LWGLGVPDKPAGWDTLLDWYIDANRRLWRREYDRKRDGWRASSFGYCPTRLIMARAGIEAKRKIDTKTRRTFEWGDKVHDFVKSLLWRSGLMLADESPLAWGSLTGHLDALTGADPSTGLPRDVLSDPAALETRRVAVVGPSGEIQFEDRPRWSPEWKGFLIALRAELAEQEWFEDLALPTGLEIKSAHSYAMQMLKKEGKPYPHHVGQVAAMALMQRETKTLPVQPVRWRIMYVGKDSTGVLNFELGGGMIDAAARKLELLDQAWDDFLASGALPACTCYQTNQVKICDYADGAGGCCGKPADDMLGEALAESLRRRAEIQRQDAQEAPDEH
jgi:hypothetical protein